MHVDEKKIKSDNLLNSVKVVLVGTTHPGNIGATARAMKNMGILDPVSYTHLTLPTILLV